MSNLTRILLYFYISLSSTFVYASVINITETINLDNNYQSNGGTLGSFYEHLEQGPVKISNGDKVVLNIDFMGKQALRINNGASEAIKTMLLPWNNLSSFSISNATVKLLGFTGTGGAQSTYSIGSQSDGEAYIGTYLSDFLSGGQSVTFGGLKVTFDVNSIAQSPNTYSTFWLVANSETGVSVTNNSTVQPLAVPKQNASTVFGMPLVGKSAINLTTQAGGVSSVDGVVKDDKTGDILSTGFFDYYHQPNKGYYAIDLSSDNASVVAAKSGTVVSIQGGSKSGYGYKCANAGYNCIVIDHGNGLFTEYREFTDAAINPKTGKYYKIGDAVDEGGVIGKLKGGHLHFQVMTFDKGTGLFSSSKTDNNKVLENVTVGGVKLTDYKLDGNFQVTPSGNTYTVTGTPLKHLISNATTQSSLSLVNSNTINSSVSGSGGSMKEGSPAYIWDDWMVPLNASYIEFEYFWGSLGDGDWLSVYFGDTLLFSSLGIDFIGNDYLSSGLLWIGQFAGETDQLLFALNSVGDSNAELSIRNLRVFYSEPESSVPEPSTALLLLIGIFSLTYFRHRNSK